MKKFKITITSTVSDVYFETEALNMKAQIESGEAKKDLYKDSDKKLGISDVEITFEEIPV